MNRTTLAALFFATSGLAATLPAAAQEATYDVDANHAFVHFEVRHFGTSTNRGRFDTVEGHVTLDRKAGKGSADIIVKPGSVNTGIPGYNEHLKDADFLNTKAFPEARFTSNSFLFENGKVKSVAGTLTLMGKQQPVTLNAIRFNCYDSPILKTEACGGDFETTIKRSDYGMTFGLPGIPDEVHILIQLEAGKRA